MEVLQEGRIGMLDRRKKRCVCRYCGGALELRRVMFHDIDEARTEIYCQACNKIEFGTESEIYKIAKYFTEEFDFSFQIDDGDDEKNKRYVIAKLCDILAWGLKNLNYMNDEGFLVKPELQLNFLQECLCLKDCDLEVEGEMPV